MTRASAMLRLGSSSTTAAASSAAEGLRGPHFTSRSVTSDGSTSNLACATQRALNLDTVCCKSTPSTSAYCAPGTSMRFTHTVTGAPAAAPADACATRCEKRQIGLESSVRTSTARTRRLLAGRAADRVASQRTRRGAR